MYLNSTPCTDGFNRQVHIRNKNSYVTNCIGLFKAFDFLRQSGGYDIIKSVIAPTLPYKKCRGGRTQFGNFIQRLAGILIGKEDLNDHDTIDDDPAFLSAVGLSAASGCATLCNFENSLQRHTLTAMQQVLQDLFVHYAPKHPDILWVDVDCTPIYVYGNQENKEFSGHYGDYCLMAMVIFINNFPVYVTLDRGCQDGRAMLEEVYEEVIDFLRERIPTPPSYSGPTAGLFAKASCVGSSKKAPTTCSAMRRTEPFRSSPIRNGRLKPSSSMPVRETACLCCAPWESTRSIGRRSGRLTHTRTFV